MSPLRTNSILASKSLRFADLLRAYRGHVLVGSVLLLATNVLLLIIPRLIKQVVDALESGGVAWGWIAGMAGLIAGIALAQAVVRTGSRVAILGMSRKVVADLRTRVFRHLQELPLQYFQRTPTGDVLNRAINDTRQIRSLMGPGVLNAVNTAMIYLGALVILLWMDWRLTLLAMVPYPFLLIAVRKLAQGIHSHSTEVQERLSDLSAKLQENLNGIQVVKSYVREDAEIDSFRGHAERYFGANRGLIQARSRLIPLMGVMGGIGTLVVLWLGGRRVIEGSFSLGDFLAFNAYLGYLVWPTIAMGWVINVFQRGFASLQRLRQVLAEPTEVDPDARFAPLGEVRGEIELRDLDYEHPGGEGLHGVSVRVPAGSTLGIVGRIGSGKTTLLDALARLLPVDAGQVFLDGRDVTTIDPRELRRHIGFVPQDPFLFSTTIRDNIAYGTGADADAGLIPPEDEDDPRVGEAAALSQLARDVEEFPHGYETVLGERGITLSGGQRQRATLARALATEPEILVLDDVLSAVDADTEEAILGGLREARRGRTTLIVSHRISAVQEADRIIVLDEGRVVEQGTHEALAASDGIYARLYRQQDLERQLEEDPGPSPAAGGGG